MLTISNKILNSEEKTFCQTLQNTLCYWLFVGNSSFKPPYTSRSSIFIVFACHYSTNCIIGLILLNLFQRSSWDILANWRLFCWRGGLWHSFNSTFSHGKLRFLFSSCNPQVITKINVKGFTARFLDNILDMELLVLITISIVSLIVGITNIFNIVVTKIKNSAVI